MQGQKFFLPLPQFIMKGRYFLNDIYQLKAMRPNLPKSFKEQIPRVADSRLKWPIDQIQSQWSHWEALTYSYQKFELYILSH